MVVLNTEPIFDAELDVGISAKVEIQDRANGQLCVDANVAFPVVDISIGDGKVLLYGKKPLITRMGFKASWEIINFENAPKKIGFHIEKFSNGTMQYVPECTYKILEDTENKEPYTGRKRGCLWRWLRVYGRSISRYPAHLYSETIRWFIPMYSYRASRRI